MNRVLLGLFLLAGCAIAPTLPAADERMVDGCTFVGQVTGHSRLGWTSQIKMERARHDATERAHALGATHIVYTSVNKTADEQATADARAYRCPK